jgi:hypothetical protein
MLPTRPGEAGTGLEHRIPDARIHAVLRNHRPGNLARPLEVVRSAGGDISEDQSLGCPASQQGGQFGLQL